MFGSGDELDAVDVAYVVYEDFAKVVDAFNTPGPGQAPGLVYWDIYDPHDFRSQGIRPMFRLLLTPLGVKAYRERDGGLGSGVGWLTPMDQGVFQPREDFAYGALMGEWELVVDAYRPLFGTARVRPEVRVPGLDDREGLLAQYRLNTPWGMDVSARKLVGSMELVPVRRWELSDPEVFGKMAGFLGECLDLWFPVDVRGRFSNVEIPAYYADFVKRGYVHE